MNPRDPNIQMVEVVAQALGDLCDELIFVGGCAAGMLCDLPNASPPRVTYDVDVVAEVAALAAYLANRFREIVRHPDFDNTLPGLVAYDELYEDRIRRVRDRINSITNLGEK